MIFPFPTVSGKSFKIPWFQSPPTTISDGQISNFWDPHEMSLSGINGIPSGYFT